MQENQPYKNNLKKNPVVDWLRKLSINKKLSIIISLIIFISLFGVANFWLGTKIMSGIRAYVAAEGMWSKAQKEANNSLLKYSTSFDQADYQQFLLFLQLPLHDTKTRLELDKPNPNIDYVRQESVMGGNNPADVDDLIFLYQRFRHVSYMDKAIGIWAQGDGYIQQFLIIGEKIHAIISTSYDKSNTSEWAQKTAQVSALVKQQSDLDSQLTDLENSFSAILGDASRGVRRLLLLFTIALSLILSSIVLFVALLIRRIIIETDAAKTEFVSLASHQLRTPITAIKWYSEMLVAPVTGPLNEKQQKYIAEIYEGNEKMIKLINNLLNIARIEMGKLKVNIEQTDVKKILDDVVKEQYLEITKRAQKIIVNYPDYFPKISTDPMLLAMVLQNLISNAVKYTLEGGQITCTVSQEGEKILLSIQDNGIGIPVPEQKKLFEKLFRASNVADQRNQSHDRGGNGLGLYIAREITHLLGGKIWLESELDKGATFYVELPIKIK